MDTSDDPLGLGGKDVDIPAVQAKQAVRTAEPVKQISEAARKNRRRAAAFLPRGFAPPTLSQAGLLGLPGANRQGL